MDNNDNYFVNSTEDAIEVVAELLEKYSTQQAYDRLVGLAYDQKQSVSEEARRTAGNLLRTFTMRRV